MNKYKLEWLTLAMAVCLISFCLGATIKSCVSQKYPLVACINATTSSVDVEAFSHEVGDIAYSLPEKVCIRHLYNITIPHDKEPDLTILNGGNFWMIVIID